MTLRKLSIIEIIKKFFNPTDQGSNNRVRDSPTRFYQQKTPINYETSLLFSRKLFHAVKLWLHHTQLYITGVVDR